MPRRGRKAAPRTSDVVTAAPPQRDAKLEAMAKVARGMTGWRPARQVLRRVEAVPTIFPQFDKASHVGGLPIARITTIHGPSGEGKTYLALGWMLSFLQGNHFVAHVDAEMTTPVTWCEKLMAKYVDHPGYLALRPHNFEETDDGVRRFLNAIGEAKAKGIVPPDTSGVVVIDSIRKLVPKDLLKQLLKEGAENVGMDGMRGRGAMRKASLNAQWLDELVPLLHDTNCAMVLIARETEDPEADAQDRKYDRNFKIGGGKSVVYDSSITGRIQRAGWTYHGGSDEKHAIGERHRVRIWRTKVTVNEDRVTDCYFHTSNGTFTPEGFDRARDVLELAKEMEIVTGEGWLSFDGEKLGHGENQSVKKLTEHPEILAEVEQRVRAGFVVEGQQEEKEEPS